jgi:predicted lipoprotein
MNKLISLLTPTLFPVLAFAQSTDWNSVNLAVTDTHVLPAYARFAENSATLVPAATALCDQPGPESLAGMQAAFNDSMDAWQGVQHIQFGPITYFNWNFRLQFWPDDKGTGARQLTEMLAARDSSQLDTESFARQSVGVQGYPALERLIFDANSLQELQENPFQCQLVRAIAANLAEIAAGVEARWREEFRTTIANADERGFFESAEDATISYLKALVENVRRVQQQKLESVLGEDRAGSRVRRAESWRSDRSVRNLKLNAAAFHEIFSTSDPALSAVFVPEDVPVMEAAFAQLEADLALLPDSMNVALESDAGFAGLKAVRNDLGALFEALEASLKHTDLYLGFNSLDGD